MANKGVSIHVNLDINDAVASAQSLSKQIDEAISKNKGTEDPRLAKIVQDLEKIRATYSAVNSSMQKDSAAYATMQANVERLRTVEHEARIEWKAYEEDLIRSNSQLAHLVELMRDFGYNEEKVRARYFGKNQIIEGDEIDTQIKNIKELYAAWSEANRAFQSYNGQLSNLQDPFEEGAGQEYAQILKQNSDLAEILLLRMNNLSGATRQAGGSFRSGFYFARTILNDVRKSISKTTSQLKSLVAGVGHLIKRMTHLGKESRGVFGYLTRGIKQALRNIMRYGLGVRSLYFLFRRLRTYAKESLGEMAKAFPEVNQQVSRAVSALNQMKASIGTAVQPLLTILVPVLEKVAALIARIANLIGSFFALLTGQKTIYRAVATQTDYAASLEGTGKAAKDAKKALEGYLSPIDEINKYQSKKDEDTSGGGGAGGGGLTYEEVPIDPKILDLFAKLKEMWDKGDFYDLGRSIGERLRDALEAIPWDEIRETSNKLGKSVATLINGLIEVERLAYDIGTTVAQGINTVFEFINGFVHNIHWASIGTFIAETFNGFFEGIDWPLIIDTVKTGFEGLATSINSFVSDFHWDNISTFISNAVNTVTLGINSLFDNVDWETLGSELNRQLEETIRKIDTRQMGEAIGNIIHAAATLAGNLLAGLDWTTVKSKVRAMVEGFFSKLTEADKELIKDVIKNVLIVVVTRAAFAAVAPLIAKKLGEVLLGAIFGTGGAEAAGAAAGAAFGNAFIQGVIAVFAGVSVGSLIKDYIIFPELKYLFRESGMYDESKEVEALGEKYKGLGGTLQMLKDLVSGENFAVTLRNDAGEAYKSVDAYGNEIITFSKTTEEKLREQSERFEESMLKDGNTVSTAITKTSDVVVTQNRSIDNSYNTTTSDVNSNMVKMRTSITTETYNIEQRQAQSVGKMKAEYGTLVQGTSETKSKMGTLLDGIKRFFTADKWTLTGVKEGLTSTFNSAVEAIKAIWNRFADWINSKLSIDIDTSGIFGSKIASFLGTSHLSLGYIPKLAQGAVLPANKPFMAMVGDQKNGTNIETPLDTMIEAFNTALARNGGGGTTTINFVLPDRRKIAQYVLEGGKIIQTSTGSNPFQLA